MNSIAFSFHNPQNRRHLINLPSRRSLISSSSSTTTTITSRRAASDSSRDASSPSDDATQSPSLESWVHTLPRLYVGPRPTLSSSSQSQQPPISPSQRLKQDAMIRLSPDQVHYLIRVMRLQPVTSSASWSAGTSKSVQQQQQLKESGIRIFNGQDGEWLAQVINLQGSSDGDDADGGGSGSAKRKRNKRIDEEFIVAMCQQQLRSFKGDGTTNAIPSPPNVWLYMMPLPKTRIKWLVEKMTELNVAGLAWVNSDHTEPAVWKECSTSGGAFDKLVSIVMEAAEQCERLTLPQLTILSKATTAKANAETGIPVAVSTMLQNWCSPDQEPTVGSPFAHIQPRLLLIGRERQDQTVPHLIEVLQQHYKSLTVSPSSDRLQQERHPLHVGLLIGPSGGWSRREVEIMDQYELQHPHLIASFTLGSTILRSETAALAAAAVAAAIILPAPTARSDVASVLTETPIQ